MFIPFSERRRGALPYQRSVMHKQASDFQVLSECANGYIGVCACCREFNFVYKNLLLAFPEDEMFRFCRWLSESADNPANRLVLRHGRDRVYASPLSNFYLSFNAEELEEIEQMTAEAELLWQARRIARNL